MALLHRSRICTQCTTAHSGQCSCHCTSAWALCSVLRTFIHLQLAEHQACLASSRSICCWLGALGLLLCVPFFQLLPAFSTRYKQHMLVQARAASPADIFDYLATPLRPMPEKLELCSQHALPAHTTTAQKVLQCFPYRPKCTQQHSAPLGAGFCCLGLRLEFAAQLLLPPRLGLTRW